MLILVGPSASGKTEVANILIQKYGMKRMITYTTRNIRSGEIDGVSYHFIDKNEFLKMIDNDEFVESTIYNENYYGTRKSDVSKEKIVILEPNGVNAFYNKMPKDVTIVFLKTSKLIREARMHNRGDSNESIVERLANDDVTFQEKNIIHVDLTVVNENKTLEELALEIYNFYHSFNI